MNEIKLNTWFSDAQNATEKPDTEETNTAARGNVTRN